MTSTATPAGDATPYTVGITGVTGKTGSLVAEGAQARGWQVRSLTRREPDVGDWRRLDWDDQSSWGPAFAGCDAAYVLIPFNSPGAAERTPDVMRAAAAAGVRRIVLLSSLDAEGAPPGDPLAAAEAAVTALDVEWTILRPTWFFENFSIGSFGSMVRDGDLRLPAGDGRIPFVAIRDIADVAVAALAEDGPRGRLPLTGPAALTHAEVCGVLTGALQHPVRFTDAADAEFIEVMAARGFSRGYADFLIGALGRVRSNQLLIPVTDTVSRVTGRPATTVTEFAAGMAPRHDDAIVQRRQRVHQLRVVVEAADYDEALRFYRDVLGTTELAAFAEGDDDRVAILDAGRATVEIANPVHRQVIDDIEAAGRPSPRIRLAFEVSDADAVTDDLVAAGAQLIAEPVETPWRSLNSRMDGPADLQITLFQELENAEERQARSGFTTDSGR